MIVKEFLSVCNYDINRLSIKDFSGNIYLLNGRKYAHYEDMEIYKVSPTYKGFLITLNTYAYDGEYKAVN